MPYAFFRPNVLAAAIWLSVPMALSAQTAPARTPDASTTTTGASSTSATHANPGVASAAGAFDGQRTTAMNQQGNASSVAKADRDFLRTAAGAGMYEVEVSRLALERATQAEVKEFAQKMVSDHTEANEQLAALARARGVELPKEMPKNKRQVIDRLKKSNNFDKDYVKTVGLKDHKADIALFDKAHRTSRDEELKTWAGEKLPTLQTHLTHAQEIYSQNMQKTGRPLPGIKTAPTMPDASSLSSAPPAGPANR